MIRAHRSVLAAATLLVAVAVALFVTGCRVTVRVDVGPRHAGIAVRG